MSAFMVDREDIRFLVSAARKLGNRSEGLSWFYNGYWTKFNVASRDQASRLGQVLWDANLKSINTRYPDTVGHPENIPGEIGQAYVYAHSQDFPLDQVELNQVFKSIRFLSYQSNEFKGWEESEAYAILEALKDAAIDSMPGYDDAVWGSPEPKKAAEVR